MIVTTAAEAREADRRAMEDFGIPEAVLMESAGAAVVRCAGKIFDFRNKKILIICGTGNNGGDGFVAARYLADAGAEVFVLLMGNPAHMGASAKMYRQAAEKMGVPVTEISAAAETEPLLARADLIVDALIGTGLSSAVTGEKAKLIALMNEQRAVKFSVDVPSGMNADTGRAEGAVVRADMTVALGTVKRGHFLYPGTEYCGELRFAPIGIPEKARADFPVRLMDAETAASLLPVRTKISHKGSNGFTGIFAGSAGMEGAGLLAGLGALRAGAGKLALNSVDGVASLLSCKAPEIMVHGMGVGNHFSPAHLPAVLAAAETYDAVAIGPGFGRSEETQAFVESFLKKIAKPIVVDADALFAAAEKKLSLKDMPGTLILTPHVGEFAKLTGMGAKDIEAHRIDAAISYAKENGVVLVLKGAPTVTALPDGTAFVNTTGNPGMATGGMGDTLTGIIASLAGQGVPVGEAAALGVYLHGLAGDLLAKETPVGYTAGDLAGKLPEARGFLIRNAELKTAASPQFYRRENE